MTTQILSFKERLYDIEAGVSLSSPGNGLRAEKENNDCRGRPTYIIQKEQLVFLRELRFAWTMIASMYGVCRRTIYNIRSRHGLLSCQFPEFTCITDDDLKCVMSDIKREMPELGQSMIRGVLESRGIHVSTTRIRECLFQIDSINNTLCWSSPISKQVYSVPRLNSLWHIDGNHKLIR